MNVPSTVEQYETLMVELERLVAELEGGALPLAELVARYEKAVALATECQRLLDEASLRVEQY